jgi:hypothetical protein
VPPPALSMTVRICAADQEPPRGAVIPAELRPAAIAASECAPVSRTTSICRITFVARKNDAADRDRALAAGPSLRSAPFPLHPPSFVPRAFAAARASVVRFEMAFRSAWATAAMIWIVSSFASGRSAATNRMPLSCRAARNATFLLSRSSFATNSVAPVRSQRARAASSWGRASTSGACHPPMAAGTTIPAAAAMNETRHAIRQPHHLGSVIRNPICGAAFRWRSLGNG